VIAVTVVSTWKPNSSGTSLEQIENARTPGRGLQHPRLAVGQDGELESLLLERLETRLYVREGRKTHLGVHQLLLPVGRQVDLEALAGPDETNLR
jgi:hypothetical protein